MARTRTTLAVAQGINDKTLVVASATGFAAGMFVIVDAEVEQVTKDYVSGVTIPVLRGVEGSVQKAHVITSGAVVQLGSDFGNPAPGDVFPTSATQVRTRLVTSITAVTSTLTLPPLGQDLFVVLNGTAAITLTVPVPTTDMDGTEITIASNGVAQHILTFTGGLSGAGGSYDVVTINATAPMAMKVVACNGLWLAPAQPAISGTTTNIAGVIS